MGRKGDCWDNAVVESFFKTIKVELVYRNDYHGRQEASIFKWIDTWDSTNMDSLSKRPGIYGLKFLAKKPNNKVLHL